jgi:CubicO group peptidase (beta-lactamase class C family)
MSASIDGTAIDKVLQDAVASGGGKVVEAVTGVGLDVAIKQGITGPLGMDQTTFLMNDDQRPNSTHGWTAPPASAAPSTATSRPS